MRKKAYYCAWLVAALLAVFVNLTGCSGRKLSEEEMVYYFEEKPEKKILMNPADYDKVYP